MEKRIYTIDMYTPIGVRQGVLSATLQQDRVFGTIEILRHTDSFEGTIEKDGNCRIQGRIVSLMQTIEYIAAGRMTQDHVSLQLQGKGNTFWISGRPSLTEGEKIHE